MTKSVTIDRERSTQRIENDIETLAGPDFTESDQAIRRYAYTPQYENTLQYFTRELEQIGFSVWRDPVGTLIASNVPKGAPAFGVGSHCDSNRNGGKYDGTLGVVTALEVCRLAQESDQQIPLRLISFLEEEGSGFGQMLLGSRIMAQRVTEEELKTKFLTPEGVPFWDAAKAAGYEPERWRESAEELEGLTGWIELHIEQGRVLQDTGNRIGVVHAIAGYVHGDFHFAGRADHAGATPMNFRVDAALPAAETILEVERLANEIGDTTVGTTGEIESFPSLINVVPGGVRVSLDTRSVTGGHLELRDRIVAYAEERAEARGVGFEWVERQGLDVTPMSDTIVEALRAEAEATGEPFIVMPSGAAHDTMCVADSTPTAMVFVPCLDGLSHTPLEDSDTADAALAAEIILGAIMALDA
ncbi:MAG: Zn-dependent hydrolase [Thermoleophilia bacterium]|nr:Zn-dependent hydrolase [Thermoleophilia bacterium]